MRFFQVCKIAVVMVWLVGVTAFFIVLLVPNLITSAQLSNPSPLPKQAKEIEGYKNWAKANHVPQLMPKRVATDCFLWLSPSGVVVNDQSNPHREKYFIVYVNEVGRKAMLRQKNPRFPEGSIIVKEKLPAKDSQAPELLTVMIKQEKGYNPASGDWEYMVLDGSGTKVQGRGNLQNCQTCHLANEKTDYIFRTYLTAEMRGKLK